jgi:hypothetical protein
MLMYFKFPAQNVSLLLSCTFSIALSILAKVDDILEVIGPIPKGHSMVTAWLDRRRAEFQT